jgi:hypothetical protein
MDYLDPAKQARNRVTLFIGYILVTVGIVIATIILLNQAYGFGLGKHGNLIQNGLVFFSSQPSPANLYINGKLKDTTNTRLYLPENIYKVSLSRSGYDDWQHTIEINGGSVEHYDYPFLFPKTITTTKLASYSAAPGLITQSPDRRWLLVSRPSSLTDFDLYDLKNPTKAATLISLPANLLTKATGSEDWQFVDWADDNQHVLLQHDFDNKSEFILLDRANPEQSINLNTNLSINPTKLDLKNKKYDQYYFYDATSQNLQTASLQSTVKTTLLQHVLAYQSYEDDTLLYVTDKDAPAGEVWLRMLSNGTTYDLHTLPVSANYVLDLTGYSGTLYVAAGASSANKVYIYKDPLGQLAQTPHQAVSPIQVLSVTNPTYLSFSDNAQFIVTENSGQFGVYDIENQKGYNYKAAAPDSPQLHASWMDGDRLTYVSNDKLLIFDYDHTNQHSLVKAASQYLPVFAPDYKYVYTLAQNSSGQYDLDQTWLLAPADR